MINEIKVIFVCNSDNKADCSRLCISQYEICTFLEVKKE